MKKLTLKKPALKKLALNRPALISAPNTWSKLSLSLSLLVLSLLLMSSWSAAKANAQEPTHDLTTGPLTLESLVEALALDEPPPAEPPKTRGMAAQRSLDCSNTKTRGISAEPNTHIAAIEVLFAVNSDQLTDVARSNLDVLGQALRSQVLRQCCILIEGHTDATGSEAHNQGLSERRAAQVKKYLEQHNQIDTHRLQFQGFGEARPIANNANDDGRRRNRRVQIVNLGYGSSN